MPKVKTEIERLQLSLYGFDRLLRLHRRHERLNSEVDSLTTHAVNQLNATLAQHNAQRNALYKQSLHA